jgi:hypothetical protein
MVRKRTFWNYPLAIAFTFLIQFNSTAQSNNKFSLKDSDSHKDDIVMTWNKKTPESEMKDDIKSLSDKGITIKYSDIKRNAKDEITSIRVEYSDRKGNKGNIEYNNQKPIGVITFYKSGDEVGFGDPNGSDIRIANNDFLNRNGFTNPQDLMKQFQLGNGDKNSQSFSFNFPNDGESFGQSKSKIMIQKNGKKPLVIEDGKVTEGGDDYSPEEIDKIKNENKVESFSNDGESLNSKEFDFRSQEGLDNFKKQMERKIPNKNQSDDANSDFNQTKEEMIKAKEEMIKAKEELEKAKKDIEKSKAKLKTQKV